MDERCLETAPIAKEMAHGWTQPLGSRRLRPVPAMLDDTTKAFFDQLVKSHKVVLFMKGNKSFPQCGFSASVVEVLKRCGAEMSRANIMKQVANLRGVEVPLLLPGIKMNTSPTDFFPIEAVQMQRFKGEGWELFGGVLSNESS